MFLVCRNFSFPNFFFKRGFRRKFFTFIVVVAMLYFSFLMYQRVQRFYFVNFTCSFKDVQNAIKSICDSYYSNLFLGNMCSSLCITGKLRPVRCISHHSGKEIVFEAKWNDLKVVVKALHSDSKKYEQIYWTDQQTGKNSYPELPVFFDMLSDSLEKNLNLNLTSADKIGESLINRIWTLKYNNFLKLPIELQHSAMNNLWYLVQQPEYLMSKIYENHQVFPRIIGTCGHAFAAEYLQPLDSFFSVLHPHWRYSFEKRAKWALGILYFVEKLESQFKDFMHLCDVKMSHFGYDQIGEIKFIDLDMVFSEETVKQNLLINSCKDDCSFIHCQGVCNLNTGSCKDEIINNNLQRVCSNIFHGFTWKLAFGLLSNPPIEYAEDLNALLNSCSTKNESFSNRDLSAKLENILKRIINSVNQK